MTLQKAHYKSPIGWLEIAGTEEGIESIHFIKKMPRKLTPVHPKLKECVNQLDEYFKGKRKEFSVKLILEGTKFQKRVWRELLKIPFGQTASYGDIARRVGNKKAGRAVGNANNRNRITLLVPCHRVIGSDGTLVGYGGSLWRKEWLLRHEGSWT